MVQSLPYSGRSSPGSLGASLVADGKYELERGAIKGGPSTPGLIDPTLSEIPGNRIPLPDLTIPKRRRPRNGNGNADNSSTLPPMQHAHTCLDLETSASTHLRIPSDRKGRCESAHRLQQPREDAGYELHFFGVLLDMFPRVEGDSLYRASVPSLKPQEIALTL